MAGAVLSDTCAHLLSLWPAGAGATCCWRGILAKLERILVAAARACTSAAAYMLMSRTVTAGMGTGHLCVRCSKAARTSPSWTMMEVATQIISSALHHKRFYSNDSAPQNFRCAYGRPATDHSYCPSTVLAPIGSPTWDHDEHAAFSGRHPTCRLAGSACKHCCRQDLTVEVPAGEQGGALQLVEAPAPTRRQSEVVAALMVCLASGNVAADPATRIIGKSTSRNRQINKLHRGTGFAS